MHNKTWISALGWFLSIGGWFLWTVFLSVVFKPGKMYPLYAIKDGFIKFFGRDLLWWVVLLLTLTSVTLLEIGVSSVRKSFWPTETDIFQELQKDKVIRERFEETLRVEAEGGGEVQMGKEKTSMDARREGEIQELLDRPRYMAEGLTDAEVMRSPVEMTEGGVSRSASGSHLTRRKFSTDGNGNRGGVEEFEMLPRSSAPQTRHSIDIAEVLGRSSRQI